MPKASRRKIDYNGKYDAANYKMVVIRLKRDSDVLDALEKRLKGTGMTKSEYIRAALEEMPGQHGEAKRE